jgi:putative endonuclease
MADRPSSPWDRFKEQDHNRARGATAEATAVAWLKRQGYRILESNLTTKAGEIDVVAVDGETLCFIEIKARSTPSFGEAIEAVDVRKQRRIARAASLYLVKKPFPGPCRFDVLGLDPAPEGWRFTLVRNAFELG